MDLVEGVLKKRASKKKIKYIEKKCFKDASIIEKSELLDRVGSQKR